MRGGHAFCSTCGVAALNLIADPDGKVEIQPVNMRVLDGVDLGVCKVNKLDGLSMGGGPRKEGRMTPD